MRCGACGTENPAANRFCDSCGSPLSATCVRCGGSNRPDARFCGSCGATLTDEPAPPTQEAAVRPVMAEPGSERRLVTVLFADLVGFTTLAEDRDPEAVRELLTRYFDRATEVVGLHGGTVEKFIGDAVMAVWGTPVAHEDDAERAVRAALELVDAVAALHPGLKARAGVLTGDAAVTLGATNQGMVAGDLVNTAARLQGVAEAGTVLVGDATRHAAEQSIVFEPLGEHSLKGRTSPVPAWRAVRVVAQRGGQGRADSLEPPFVGRDEELRQLKDVLHAVGREAKPRLVSITGPGGIGKSRLAWELLKYIDGISEDIWWHRGRSPSYGEGITFWALGEMVRRRAGLTEDDDEATTRQRIAATLDEYVAGAADRERIGPALLTLLGVEEAPPGGRDALFPAWRTFFEHIAGRGTTVLVFEDLQWADTGLLDFIDHLLDWTRGLPIMVVTLARPELFDRRPDWGAARRQLTALALEPLSDDAVRQLLEGLVPGLPADALAAIVGRADGVPLYAVETVRGLLADGLIERQGETYAVAGDLSRLRVPDSLRSLIASRLDALDAEDRALLQDAAVLGQVFSSDSLAAVTGVEASALEPRLRALVRGELLDIETDPQSPERGQYRFVQALIREVAYGTLSRRDRRARHLAVARQYEAAGDDELAGALASHYVAAYEASAEGPEADTIATQARIALVAAAERALALGAPSQAIVHLEQALAVTIGAPERAPLLDRAAYAAASAAVADAQRYAEEAVAAYEEIGDAAGVARSKARLGRVLLDGSLVTPAIEVLSAAAEEAEGLDNPVPLATILANLSRAYMRNGMSAESIAAADRALPIAEAHHLEAVIVEAFVNKGASLGQSGRLQEGIALLAAAALRPPGVIDPLLAIRARNNYGSLIMDDDPATADRIIQEALELSRDIGDRGMYNWQLGNLAAGAFNGGRDWDRYLELLEDALEAATLPTDRGRLLTFIALLSAARGERLDELTHALGREIGDDRNIDQVFSIQMTTAGMHVARGNFRAAYDAAKVVADLRTQAAEIPVMFMLRAALTLADPALIRDTAARVAALPPGGRNRDLYYLEGEGARAAVDGRTDEGVRDLLAVHHGLRDLGLRYEASVSVVSALHTLPHAAPIRAAAEATRPLLEELRARPLLDQLDAALADGAPQGESSGTPVAPPAARTS